MAEAARRYKPGALDPESLTRLTNLVARRDGPAIAAEIEKHLLGGEAGFAFLCELLRKFDEDFKVGGLFAADYRITFSLTMLAMLHEVETAGFAHYYLVVTRDEPNAFLRQKLYDFIPVMLQFYRGRFPDLEDAFRSDIVEKLQAGKGDVQRLFTAMRALGFQLDLETAWKMLSAASDLQHVTLLVNHIADRNDEGAVQALTRFIDRKDDFQSSHVHLALAALARMSTPEAERVLLNRYLSGRRRDAVEPATRAYFAVPREPTAATLALRFLNSPETDLKGKEAFINFLRQKNPLVLEELRKRAAEISSEPVRAPVLR
jgi:hypothetical protein